MLNEGTWTKKHSILCQAAEGNPGNPECLGSIVSGSCGVVFWSFEGGRCYFLVGKNQSKLFGRFSNQSVSYSVVMPISG